MYSNSFGRRYETSHRISDSGILSVKFDLGGTSAYLLSEYKVRIYQNFSKDEKFKANINKTICARCAMLSLVFYDSQYSSSGVVMVFSVPVSNKYCAAYLVDLVDLSPIRNIIFFLLHVIHPNEKHFLFILPFLLSNFTQDNNSLL